MSEVVKKRLSKVLLELNISVGTAAEYLAKQGIEIKPDPNAKLDQSIYKMLEEGFAAEKSKKMLVDEINQGRRDEKEKQKVAKEKLAAQAEAEALQKLETEKLEAEKAIEKAIELQKKLTQDLNTDNQPIEQNVQAQTQVVEQTLEPDKKPTQDVIEQAPVNEIKAPEVDLSNRMEIKAPELRGTKVVGKIDLPVNNRPVYDNKNAKGNKKEDKFKKEEKKEAKVFPKIPIDQKVENKEPKIEPKEQNVVVIPTHVETQYQKLDGPKTVGRIDLSQFQKPSSSAQDKVKRKRKRGEKVSGTSLAGNTASVKPNVGQTANNQNRGQASSAASAAANKKNKNKNQQPKPVKVEASEEEISRQIKETLDKLTQRGGKNKAAKYRKEKRGIRQAQNVLDAQQKEIDSKIIKVTEFVTVSEFATMMQVPVNQVIASCMQLGFMTSMNQRLDAETISVIADEFGYSVEFISADLEEAIMDTEDTDEELIPRAPIVTVMGHVDHGKTSLLDYIRKANVIAGEAGGITQHIAAYRVKIESGEKITFLDTPGHEAFTAMRARGAKVTDIAIIVIATDSDVMPQTKEAIAHAQAAAVPMIFALNKCDLPTSNPDKIRESLSSMNILVEEWGGKYQSQEISSKKGDGVKELLEKVLLEAEMLNLRANPNKNAIGTIIEASLDKGRGFVTTVLVQNGTLKVGDYMLAGQNSGKVKAMFDERGKRIEVASAAKPVLVLGLDGSPTAGDQFKVFSEEKEAKSIAAKRTQLKREQDIRTSKHITLDEIGRRIAIGDFKELNIIIKGDVDGSVEALTDSLQNLSTEKIHVNIIHKGVGQVSESDVLLASASEAIIVSFNVRPSSAAKKLAEQEQIDIRTYSVIYDAINEIKDAMEGMLAPVFKEEIVCEVEVRQTYKISKVGTIAGCMVLVGKISRNTKIRIIREGVVIHQGTLASLKRFKEDVKDVSKGYECGLNIDKFNDIKEGDIIEGFQMVEVKPKL